MPEHPAARGLARTLPVSGDGVLQWRPLLPGDRAFLRTLFAESRAELIAQLPVTGAARDALIDLQLRAQEQGYRQQCAEVQFLVLTLKGQPVGRLTLGYAPGEVQLTDLVLLARWQGRGLGAHLLRRVMAQAAAQDRCVRLSVAAGNPAERLYRRLGFQRVGGDAMYLHLRWPACASTTAPGAALSEGETHAAT